MNNQDKSGITRPAGFQDLLQVSRVDATVHSLLSCYKAGRMTWEEMLLSAVCLLAEEKAKNAELAVKAISRNQQTIVPVELLKGDRE